ncbi:LexA family transcriptional regulator [Methylomonas sp. 2BW1-5-20]|uniref:LexA family transcriptional regulator n=1 Tax=Methylomonas sp. 2BW1-5-20 TaxID=3376686 RepID=UPI0040515AA9
MELGTEEKAANKSSELVPSSMPKLGTRISVVCEAIGDRKTAASVAGVSTDSLQRYIRDEVQAPFVVLARLCAVSGHSLDWLATDEGPMRKPDGITDKSNHYHVAGRVKSSPDSDAYCYIPLYDVYASAGHGALIDNEQVIDRLPFKQEWLRGEMGLNPDDCCLINVTGDSMEPLLHKKDVAMLDRSQTHVIEDGIYCLRLDGSLLIKRIQRVTGQKLKVISDNSAYEAFALDNENNEHQQIIGRVVWVGKSL